MTPLGFVPLTDAITLCGEAWKVDAADAWAKLRPWLHSGRVGSCSVGADGQQRPAANEWGAPRNDAAFKTSALLYPHLYADGHASRAAFVETEGLNKLISGSLPNGRSEREEVHLPRNQGGAPEKFDWEAMWIEIACILHEEGIPETELKLRKRVEIWFQAQYDKCPSVGSLKPKVKRLWDRLSANHQ